MGSSPRAAAGTAEEGNRRLSLTEARAVEWAEMASIRRPTRRTCGARPDETQLTSISSTCRRSAEGDVRRDARFLDEANDAYARAVAHTGEWWRSLRAPACSAHARLEAEAGDERAFAARGIESSQARVFAAIAAAAPPRGPFAEDDFGASKLAERTGCLLYTSPSPRDGLLSRMPSSA